MLESNNPGAAGIAVGVDGVEAGAVTCLSNSEWGDEQIPLPLAPAPAPAPPPAVSFSEAASKEGAKEVFSDPIDEVLPGICTYTLEELLSAKFPPRENLLEPWLPEKGIAMIYAPRGVGKTHLALGCACAVASGGEFLKWRAARPRRVLLLDGEMPVVALQERLDAIVVKTGVSVPEGFITIMPYDACPEGGPDLSTEEGQAILEPFIGNAELIVVDSISTICRGGKENEAESWAAIQSWALGQRRRGRTVLFVHHSGKSGDQRGTSKREDVLDTVIKLVRPADYCAEDGARFIVEFTKNRGFMGPDAASFEAALSDGDWTTRVPAEERTARILELRAQGMTQRQIAKEMAIGLGTVSRAITRAVENGGVTEAAHRRAGPLVPLGTNPGTRLEHAEQQKGSGIRED